MRPDPTFYSSPRLAMQAPREGLAYVALADPERRRPDAVVTVGLDPRSPEYGKVVGRLEMPEVGDELCHLGWNACSSSLCPCAPHPHAERRYLLAPGMGSSRIHVLDVGPDPRDPRPVETIEAKEIFGRTGYTVPYATHSGPDGIYVSALGAAGGTEPGGIFVLDPETFEIRGRWELERGPQRLAHDFCWHLGHDTAVSSEWATPRTAAAGLCAEALRSGGYGHALHVWDLRRRRHRQVLDLGAQHQMVLGLRPAHDPMRSYGFAATTISRDDLSASIWVWHQGGGNGRDWQVRKVITIPARNVAPELLPEALRGFGALPPLITGLSLSLDDRLLYVSCWGSGELLQYQVADPFHPVLVGGIALGGIVDRAPHPSSPSEARAGGPQTVVLSRDGRRAYVTNSFHTPWDAQLYPDGIGGWMAKVDVDLDGGMRLDPDFLAEFGQMRPRGIRLRGGDASSDSYCFP